jgi:myo-inositol-1(or 4)-monophosphatase
MTSIPEETRIAMEAARLGGDVLMRFWQRLESRQIHEKGRGDLVTEADLASEEAIATFLGAEMPEAGIVAEEGGARRGSARVWYVDPLDGTTNFVQKFPIFAVSIALADNPDRSRPDIATGVVFNPVSGDRFWAFRGVGSFLHDQRLSVSSKRDLGDAVIATGFPRRFHDELSPYLREFRALYPACRAIRRAGSAALDLCWTAQGVFDGFWEHKLSPWDIAAGSLIVREAGGICTDLDAGTAYLENGNILGASPAIHSIMLAHIQRARSGPGE